MTGETGVANLKKLLSEDQLQKCARDPEMVLDLAHQLRDSYQAQTRRTPEVRAVDLVCYNGRKPQLLIDPTADLAAEPRGFHDRSWIMPQTEPLPAKPWHGTAAEWQQAVQLHTLPQAMQLEETPRAETPVSLITFRNHTPETLSLKGRFDHAAVSVCNVFHPRIGSRPGCDGSGDDHGDRSRGTRPQVEESP